MTDTFFSGDTVTFMATFRDVPEVVGELGALIDPDDVTFHVLNADRDQIHEAPAPQVSTGFYMIDYTVPAESGTYYVEWIGTVNGKPEIKRGKFKVKFLVE